MTVVDEPQLLGAIRTAVDFRVPTVFVGLYAALYRAMDRDPAYAALVRESVTYPDGAGVVTELHRRGAGEATRLATTDLAHPIAGLAAARSWRVGLYGSAPGVAERAADRLRESAPGIEIVAIWDGYGGGPSVTDLRRAHLDLIFVGLGAPLQEHWSYEVAVNAGIPAILPCGGLFDFLAGDKRRAPAWMQRAGLEWAFRVLLEPRRLFTRYLCGNLFFLRQARAERLRLARQGVVAQWSDTSDPSSPGLSELRSASGGRGTGSATRT